MIETRHESFIASSLECILALKILAVTRSVTPKSPALTHTFPDLSKGVLTADLLYTGMLCLFAGKVKVLLHAPMSWRQSYCSTKRH